MFVEILNTLKEISQNLRLIKESQKEILTLEESARYLGVSRQHLSKLLSDNEIPYFKPSRKLRYIYLNDLKSYMTRNRIYSDSDLDEQVANTLILKSLKNEY